MTHRHVYDQKCVPIDEHVCLRPTVHDHDGERHLCGYLIAHDTDRELGAPDARCEGGISTCSLDGREPWTKTGELEDGDLTLSPSVLCVTDGFHGYVRDGAWVPA